MNDKDTLQLFCPDRNSHQLFDPNLFKEIENLKEDINKPRNGFQKPIALWKWIISKTNPTSLLDPFIGSGTTAEVCEELGISWLGFEIMDEYAKDIEKRIKHGIAKHSQSTLSSYLQNQ